MKSNINITFPNYRNKTLFSNLKTKIVKENENNVLAILDRVCTIRQKGIDN